jgi:hypothetical protein
VRVDRTTLDALLDIANRTAGAQPRNLGEESGILCALALQSLAENDLTEAFTVEIVFLVGQISTSVLTFRNASRPL